MKTRPILVPGAICKLSNHATTWSKRYYGKDIIFMVHDPGVNPTSGREFVYTYAFNHQGRRISKATFRRRELWFTGHIGTLPAQRPTRITQSIVFYPKDKVEVRDGMVYMKDVEDKPTTDWSCTCGASNEDKYPCWRCGAKQPPKGWDKA